MGQWVLVPFGQATREGLVVSKNHLLPDFDSNQQRKIPHIKDIIDIVPTGSRISVDPSLLTLAQDIGSYYLAPLTLCLRLFHLNETYLPRISQKIYLTELGRKASVENRRLQPITYEILTRLDKAPKGLTLATLKRHAPSSIERVLQGLRNRGWIDTKSYIPTVHQTYLQRKVTPLLTQSDPNDTSEIQSTSSPTDTRHEHERTLSATQLLSKVSDEPWRIECQEALQKKQYQPMFFFAPKAELLSGYICAIQETLGSQRNALMITPELERAESLVNHIKPLWGNQVALFHSGLSNRERLELGKHLEEGKVRVVIGTRSALFIALPNLGLIGVDQEDNPLLKDEQRPYYHVREVAQMRASQASAVFLLGTSHPSMETYFSSSQSEARRELLTFERRKDLPRVQVINLKEIPYEQVLSDEMIHGIRTAIDQKGGALIFLNRKGFSSALSCKACGFTPHCQRCHVSFTVFKTPARLCCTYCGASQSIPLTCPSCHATHLHPVGFGTERIEELLRQRFPTATIARFDRDALPTPSAARKIRDQFQQDTTHILIGTQLLLPALSVPKVQFVGVPYADAGLHFPDFRSSERVFHQLASAVELAHSQKDGGHVVIQTYLPTHHVLQSIVEQDPTIFYEHELAFREVLDYPPFTHLILLQVAGEDSETVRSMATKWANELHQVFSTLQKDSAKHDPKSPAKEFLLGPIPAHSSKGRGKSRFKILIKAKDLRKAGKLIQQSLTRFEEEKKRNSLKFSVNVDPMEAV